jgi:hypothetical protein
VQLREQDWGDSRATRQAPAESHPQEVMILGSPAFIETRWLASVNGRQRKQIWIPEVPLARHSDSAALLELRLSSGSGETRSLAGSHVIGSAVQLRSLAPFHQLLRTLIDQIDITGVNTLSTAESGTPDARVNPSKPWYWAVDLVSLSPIAENPWRTELAVSPVLSFVPVRRLREWNTAPLN